MNNLKYYRENAGLSQYELSERTGIEQSLISRAEIGVKDLPGQRWKVIAKVLNCSIDDLLEIEKRR